jgi:hypothetical protein
MANIPFTWINREGSHEGVSSQMDYSMPGTWNTTMEAVTFRVVTLILMNEVQVER